MASGPVCRIKGRTHGCTDQGHCIREESSCQLGAVHTWRLASIRIDAPNARYRVHSGHCPAPALIGPVAIYPKRTFAAQCDQSQFSDVNLSRNAGVLWASVLLYWPCLYLFPLGRKK
jgi:hypothetical protein